MAIVTTDELREELVHREQIAIGTLSSPKRSVINEHARKFLKDLSKFKECLDMFYGNQCFVLIEHRTSYSFKRLKNTTILFDSSTITLLKIDDNFFIHLIDEYRLK